MSPSYLHTVFLGYAQELTLCMLAFWSHEGVVFLDFLPSSHSITSFLFPCLGSTDAPCPRLGDPVPPPPKWRPHSQGPHTLPYRDPEQFVHNKKMSISRLHGKYTEKGPRKIAWVAVSCVNYVHSSYPFYINYSHFCPLHAPTLSLSILTSPPSPTLIPYPYFSLSLSFLTVKMNVIENCKLPFICNKRNKVMNRKVTEVSLS
jgi:hypothetical protein